MRQPSLREAVARAIEEARLARGLSDEEWQVAWDWHTSADTIARGGRWEIMEMAKAAIAAVAAHLEGRR